MMIRKLLAIVSVCALAGCSPQGPRLDKAVISIPSADCNECAATIRHAVEKLPGVKGVDIDLDRKLTVIEFVASQSKIGDLETAIVMAGYKANDKPADEAAYQKLPACCRK